MATLSSNKIPTHQEYVDMCSDIVLRSLEYGDFSVTELQDNPNMPFRKNIIRESLYTLEGLGKVLNYLGIYSLSGDINNIENEIKIIEEKLLIIKKKYPCPRPSKNKKTIHQPIVHQNPYELLFID